MYLVFININFPVTGTKMIFSILKILFVVTANFIAKTVVRHVVEVEYTRNGNSFAVMGSLEINESFGIENNVAFSGVQFKGVKKSDHR